MATTRIKPRARRASTQSRFRTLEGAVSAMWCLQAHILGSWTTEELADHEADVRLLTALSPLLATSNLTEDE